ncbi:hypothetical protein EL22_13115 [Halostagnicola sp. A56]|uniref:hypothetical protein n=1 Tax=Halostagnicola sp. A56 TaxID=1495067 RepID=UPI00049ED22F|nr:hypothetical protein [Halostagnicola sp. A56]KDE60593.1 hypothetical protein EL22_13115 [Halostagnicola sp. A56]
MIDVRKRYTLKNERLFDGVIALLLLAGIALLALNGPFSSVRSIRLVTFVLFTLPIAIAVVCYVRVVPAVSILEIAGLIVWTYAVVQGVGVAAYFLFGGQIASYPGEMAEFWNFVTLYLLTVAVSAGLYTIGATQDNRPLIKWGLVALLPVGQLVAYGVYALV